MDDIKATSEVGPDLSYDFVSRPGYQHAMATGDTEFLRLTLRTCIELGVEPASLVHALQNHDELTYELVHWSTGHRDDVYTYRGEEITGEQLGDSVRQEMLAQLTGDLLQPPHAPGDQDEVMPARGELPAEGEADPGGRTGDEGSAHAVEPMRRTSTLRRARVRAAGAVRVAS